MQELSGIRANFLKIPTPDGSDRVQVELILITSEPTYRLSNTHDVVRDRECQTHRIGMTREGAEAVIESLEEAIDEMNELAGQAPEDSTD